jgi:hypothetical protein
LDVRGLMMRLSRSLICRVISCRRRMTRVVARATKERMGCQGGAQGACVGGCKQVHRQEGAGRVQRVWRCRWRASTFLSCWKASVLAQMFCITSCRQCGWSQTGRVEGAAHCGAMAQRE